MVRKTHNPNKLLTQTELELMRILWRIGESSVHQVIEALPPDRPLAYTSVSTMLRVMAQKGFVTARKQGRGHLYQPAIARPDYESKSVDHLLEEVFEGAPLALVARLLDTRNLTAEELAAMRRLLETRGE
ncbi:BlaI/MecI/CopY family transcriptional regulator [Sulfidibacter corallicola]|uniref:BlaI/MecI/CopY family transcriptional regulator n=1 Tax=Sulfidibacter corallicola TaxID=2818388 RepID=A0A8A4THR4_SULCO|nr:BlaI/MecI/CopY family transcriptional regulator [Sulfidibacter corallicola]QTD48351.1 BlaI/MecI/CopY family transcriptional regulator [Sulfidibacter corallicola]